MRDKRLSIGLKSTFSDLDSDPARDEHLGG
jgi:hypothetical protein